MEKKLEVNNLRISFRTDAGKVQAVRDISFNLYKGETLAIVGESGSGKSVTNKAIIGISAPNAIVESGEIIYDGMDLLQIDEEQFHKLRGDKIAMIFQDPLSALDPINRIGMQLTEAMILKNRANRRESRRVFNFTMRTLLAAMNDSQYLESKGIDVSDHTKFDVEKARDILKEKRTDSEQVKVNKQKTVDFDKFERRHLKLEGAYNDAYANAKSGEEETQNLIFHIEKKAVEEFGRLSRLIIKNARKSVHKYVSDDSILPLADEFQKEANKLLNLFSSSKNRDYSACVGPLKALNAKFKEAVDKEMPNFFALAYFETFGNGAALPELPVAELNAYLRKYLDDNFMLDFIERAQKGILYSRVRSLKIKGEVIETFKANRHVFADDAPDKKAYKETAKLLAAAVKGSIDKLALVKDSKAYTFKSSLNKAIKVYFSAIPNNKKEQKRYDREMKKYNRIIARGKVPDYKVIPAKIIDLDVARQNIVTIIDNLVASYEKSIARAANFDANKETIATIDFLKEKAQAVAYRVTRMIAKDRAIKLMEEVGIPEPRKRYRQYPFEFSGGMRQRIVIAIALAANPDILICDEPTTALDVTIQAQILELINKIKKERNLSIIFITHDLGVVANMADRIAVMYAGKIVEMGTAEDIFYSPAHPYTWALLSSMPDLDTNEKLEAIPGTPPNMIYPPKGDAFAARNKYAMKIDYELQPPMFKISDTHSAATWLLHPNAPKVDPPKQVTDRIARMKKLAQEKTQNGGNDNE